MCGAMEGGGGGGGGWGVLRVPCVHSNSVIHKATIWNDGGWNDPQRPFQLRLRNFQELSQAKLWKRPGTVRPVDL